MKMQKERETLFKESFKSVLKANPFIMANEVGENEHPNHHPVVYINAKKSYMHILISKF